MGAGSDFDWKALVGGGIKSGITGVVQQAGEWGLSWALNAAFGIQVGEEAKKAKAQDLEKTLTSIQEEMTAVNTALIDISNAVTQLNVDMTLDFEQLLSNLEEQNPNNAIDNITSAWGNLGDLITNCLKEAKAGGGQAGTTSTNSSDPTLTFANNVTGTWNIPASLTTIGNGLLKGPETDNEGLLNVWTDNVIMKINAGIGDVTKGYLTLEQNFLNMIQFMYMGYSLVLNAKMRLAVAQNEPQDEIEEYAQGAGQTYLESAAVKGMLADVSQLFVQCAHRLVLSQYMLPVSGGTGFVPFTSQQDATFCISRANLLAWLINREVGGDANPGIVVTSYLRPSQMNGKTGPSLNPGNGYSASDGKPFKLTAGYASQWFKVIDFKDANCTQLLDFKASNVCIVDYAWTTPVPVVGEPVSTSGAFAQITPQYYSKATLSSKDKNGQPYQAGDDTVIYGFAIDMSGITENLIWSNTPAWSVNTSPALGSSVKDSQYVQWYPKSSTTPPTRSSTAEINITGQYKGPQETLSNNVNRKCTYVGTSTGELVVAFNCNGAISGYDQNPQSDAAVPFEVELDASLGQTSLGTQNINTPGKSGPLDWTYEPGSASFPLVKIQNFNVVANQDLTLAFNANFTAGKQNSAYDYDNHSGIGNGTGTWTLTLVTFAWSQPVPVVS